MSHWNREFNFTCNYYNFNAQCAFSGLISRYFNNEKYGKKMRKKKERPGDSNVERARSEPGSLVYNSNNALARLATRILRYLHAWLSEWSFIILVARVTNERDVSRFRIVLQREWAAQIGYNVSCFVSRLLWFSLINVNVYYALTTLYDELR